MSVSSIERESVSNLSFGQVFGQSFAKGLSNLEEGFSLTFFLDRPRQNSPWEGVCKISIGSSNLAAACRSVDLSLLFGELVCKIEIQLPREGLKPEFYTGRRKTGGLIRVVT